MKFYFSILILFGSLIAFGQTKPDDPVSNTEAVEKNFPPPPPVLTPPEEEFEVFKVVEEMPRFPGCEDLENEADKKSCANKKMLEFVYGNLEYPIEARAFEIEGTCMIRFIINENGEVTNPEIVRDVGGGCGEEALRIVKKMPNWIPGKQRGESVEVMFTLPIKFRYQEPKGGKYFVVPQMPKFSGCKITGNEKKDKKHSDQKFLEYVEANMQYPQIARKNNVEGECLVSFYVNEVGEIVDPKVERDIGDGCGDEALRLIREMPNWIPGERNGRSEGVV